MANELSRHSLLPDFVDVSIPRNGQEADELKTSLNAKFGAWVAKYGPWPHRSEVELKIHSQRIHSWYDGFIESYVTYNGESGEEIPAYLLVPRKGKQPFPAVVANHQCFVDCDIGKDAVVGKAYLRPDQAYGFELACRGFVVLAPDSINCGERNIRGVREQGERDKTKCWDAAVQSLSVKSFYLKHMWDAIRAVDVLESLDYVDSQRIGMIGHSLGAGTAFWAAARDSRIRASVLSCHFQGGLGGGPWGKFYNQQGDGLYYHELAALIAPRALLATRGRKEKPFHGQGDFETATDENSVLEWTFEYGKYLCSLYGESSGNFQVRFFDGGHGFPETERTYAYEWLSDHLK